MVCERSWVQVPVGQCAFSSSVTFGGCGWGCKQQRSDSGSDKSNLAGGNCHGLAVCLGSSVVRVLAQNARGPGFESQ